MMTCIQREPSDERQRIKDDYLGALVAPMDGMWESAVIAHADFWDIQDGERYAGYFCVGSDNELLRFYLVADYQARAQDIFRWVVSTHGIRHAIASTIEPLYFSLCLDAQIGVALHSYLFRDNKRVEPAPSLSASVFRKAETSEFDDITGFYCANTEGSGEWIEAFVHERLHHQELFGLYERRTLVATGECIPSQTQPPYADVGRVVARVSRTRPGQFHAYALKAVLLRSGLAAYLFMRRRQSRVKESHRESRFYQ